MDDANSPAPVDRLDERPLYQQVEQRIEQLIQAQGLQPGQAIPGANRLAEQWSVNYLTVRRALQNLIHRGVLIARAGRGTFVAQTDLNRRVLFVCGADMLGGDISEYYLRSFHYAKQALAQHDLKLHPVWLSNNDHTTSIPYCNARDARQQVGYLFYGCRHDHPLLNYVVSQNLPYVAVASYPRHRYHVTVDRDRAYTLAFQRLVERGHRRITCVGIDLIGVPEHPGRIAAQKVAGQLGIDLELLGVPEQRYCSEYEIAGHKLMTRLLERPEPPRGMVITDNIIGQGITRTLLQQHWDKTPPIDLVMFLGLQQIMPLGYPVDMVVFDIHEKADRVVGLLLDQLAGREPQPPSHRSRCWLLDHQRLAGNRTHLSRIRQADRQAEGMAR